MEFNNLFELKSRITPALDTRINELIALGINDITSDDIWTYLKDNVWKISFDLTLADMVSDILKCNVNDIRIYKTKIENGSDNYGH